MIDYREVQFWRRPGIEVHQQGPGDRQSVLISADGRHFRIQGFPKDIFMTLSEGKHDVRWIAAELSLAPSEDSWKKVFDALMRLHKNGLVWDVDVEEDRQRFLNKKAVVSQASRPIDFVWKHPLFPAGLVERMARPFAPLLRAEFMQFGIPLMVAAQIWFLTTHRIFFHPQYYASKFSVSSFACLVVLNYLSLFLHEFGHAAACLASGRKSGAIGVCLYIMFPGLYTDVTESWKMTKNKRLIVDAGGIYFSLIAATLATAVCLTSQSPVAGVLTCLCDLTVLVNLNPILRMDGYWILGDLLDMPHLMDLNKAVTTALLGRCLFAQRVAWPDVPRTSRWSVQIYYSYYFLFLGLTSYFAFLSLTRGLPFIFQHYPLIVQSTAQQLALAPLSWSAVQKLLALLLATASSAGLTLVCYRLGKILFEQVNMVRRTFSHADLSASDGRQS